MADGKNWRRPAAPHAIRLKGLPKQTIQLWLDWVSGRCAVAYGSLETERCSVGEIAHKIRLGARLDTDPKHPAMSAMQLVIYATPETPYGLVVHAMLSAAKSGITRIRFAVDPQK
jgi:hypothetical protein